MSVDSLDYLVTQMEDELKREQQHPDLQSSQSSQQIASFAPFDQISAKIEEIKHDVRVAVEVAILEESVRFHLGWLTQLKPDRAETYGQMLSLIGT